MPRRWGPNCELVGIFPFYRQESEGTERLNTCSRSHSQLIQYGHRQLLRLTASLSGKKSSVKWARRLRAGGRAMAGSLNGGWAQETVVHRVHLWICLSAQPCIHAVCPVGSAVSPLLHSKGTLQQSRGTSRRGSNITWHLGPSQACQG